MYCMHCGQKNDDDAKFCMSCGKPTYTIMQNNTTENFEQIAQETEFIIPVKDKTKKPSKAVIIITVAIITFFVCTTAIVIGISANDYYNNADGNEMRI